MTSDTLFDESEADKVQSMFFSFTYAKGLGRVNNVLPDEVY